MSKRAEHLMKTVMLDHRYYCNPKLECTFPPPSTFWLKRTLICIAVFLIDIDLIVNFTINSMLGRKHLLNNLISHF